MWIRTKQTKKMQMGQNADGQNANEWKYVLFVCILPHLKFVLDPKIAPETVKMFGSYFCLGQGCNLKKEMSTDRTENLALAKIYLPCFLPI